MKITKKNIVRHELIGLKVKITSSPDPSQIGIEGTIIDEYKNLIVVKTDRGVKKIEKKYRIFHFSLPEGEKAVVNGSKIALRPEDRVKIWL